MKKLKLRPGRPSTSGRAGPVDFGHRKKIRFFDPVTPGRSGNPMAPAGRVLAAGDGDGPGFGIPFKDQLSESL